MGFLIPAHARILLQPMSEGVLKFRQDGRITTCNRGAEVVMGYRADEALRS
jgi:PAS domain-containing protein